MKRTIFVTFVCVLIGLGGAASGQSAKQKQEVELLLKIIKTSADGKARASACNELADLGLVRTALIRPAEPVLLAALKDPDGAVRQAALRGLSLLEPYKKERVPNLLLLLKDGEDRNTRIAAVTMLGQTEGGAPEAIPLIEDMQKKEADKPENMRDGELLGAIGQALVGIRQHLLAGYIKTLEEDKDAKVRAAAAVELAKIAQLKAEQAKPAVPVLVKALDDDDLAVRKAALNALSLAKPEPQAVVPGLIGIVKNIREDRGLRLSAISMLGAAGPNGREALPFLEFLLDRETKKDEKNRDKELFESLTKSVEAIKK